MPSRRSMVAVGTVIAVGGLVGVAAGCAIPSYRWTPESNGDATVAMDATAGLGALQGGVIYPARGTNPEASASVLRVWVSPNPVSDDGGTPTDAMVPCPSSTPWPPAYQQSVSPAPNPGWYRFDSVPSGHYCVRVILDVAPYIVPGDEPSCGDLETDVMPATVTDATVTLPLALLHGTTACP